MWLEGRVNNQVTRGLEATEASLHKFKSLVIFNLVGESPLPHFVKGLLSTLLHWENDQLKPRGSDLNSTKCQKRSSKDGNPALETRE